MPIPIAVAEPPLEETDLNHDECAPTFAVYSLTRSAPVYRMRSWQWRHSSYTNPSPIVSGPPPSIPCEGVMPNASSPQLTPTYDGSGKVVEPSIHVFEK